CQNDYSYPYTF
nr:immunoglobulin light chain junction region [Mus musculus]